MRGKPTLIIVVVGLAVIGLAGAILARSLLRLAPLTPQGVSFTFVTEEGTPADVVIDGVKRGSTPLTVSLVQLRPMLRAETGLVLTPASYRGVTHERPENGHAFDVGVAIADEALGEAIGPEEGLLVARAMIGGEALGGLAPIRLVASDGRALAYSGTDCRFVYARTGSRVSFTLRFRTPGSE
jgi:hypothetical protein